MGSCRHALAARSGNPVISSFSPRAAGLSGADAAEQKSANLRSLNQAHPRHDVKHDIGADPEEGFDPEDAPGDDSDDSDDSDDLNRGRSRATLSSRRSGVRPERDRNGGVGPQPQRRLLLASHPSSRRGPPRPHRRRQRRRLCPPPRSPLRAPTPPTVPPSPSPFQPSPEDEAGTSTACPICLDALDLAATGNWAWLPSGLRSACPSEAAHGGPKPPALARRPERE